LTIWTLTPLTAFFFFVEWCYFGFCRTPLFLAAFLGHKLVVQFLVSLNGIDVNKSDNEGITPLMAAVMSLQPRSVRLLVSAPGIDVNMQDVRGMTALHFAVRTRVDAVVAELVRAPGINRDIKDNTHVFLIFTRLPWNMQSMMIFWMIARVCKHQ
jgi:ankyrin repeat protein